MTCKVCTLIVCCVVKGALYGMGQELPVSSYQDDFFYQQGKQLMGLLGVSDGIVSNICSTWSYPTSIVVRSIPYKVVSDPLREDFTVYSMTNDVEKIAYGDVYRRPDGYDARIFGFQCGTMMELASYVQKIDVTILDPETNIIFISKKVGAADDRDTLICKNLVVDIRGATNRMDFAVAIINAGLPESERIALPPGE